MLIHDWANLRGGFIYLFLFIFYLFFFGGGKGVGNMIEKEIASFLEFTN